MACECEFQFNWVIKELILENILNSFEYLLLVDAVLLLVLTHVKPLAAGWFVVVDVECVPFEATVIKLPLPTFTCQILNGL